jgi:hypothetical protein
MIRLPLAFTVLAGAAGSTPIKLADEIEILLSGNTAVGDWNGVPYRQFWSRWRDRFAQENGGSRRGEWRWINTGRISLSGSATRHGWYVMEFRYWY